MTAFEVLTDTRAIYTIHAVDGLTACLRIADVHQVTVVAWREVRHGFAVGAIL